MSLIAALGLAAVPGALAQERRLDGVFVRTAGDAATIELAIDTAVSKMSFIARPIARGRLKKTNPAYERIEIRDRDGQISVRFDDRKPIVMPASGEAVKWSRDDGEVFDVSARTQGMQLLQTYKAPDGERVNRFDLAADGSTLTLDVTVSSPKLPAPVRYALTYRRE